MITEQREIYTDLVREFRLLESNGEKYSSSPLMQLRQVANHPLLYRRLYNDDKVIQIAKVLCTKVCSSNFHCIYIPYEFHIIYNGVVLCILKRFIIMISE